MDESGYDKDEDMAARQDDEEEYQGNDDAESDIGNDAMETDDQMDDINTLVKALKKKKKNKLAKKKKTPEESAAAVARGVAATEALLSDHFVWENGKPEPFERLRWDLNYHWDRLDNESHCDFVDRMHSQWKKLEQHTRRELEKLKNGTGLTPIGDDGEVGYVDLVWKGRKVHCETFLKVDLSDPKDAFKSSRILDNINKKMESYDNKMLTKPPIRANIVQHLIAIQPIAAKLEKDEDIKDAIEDAYYTLDSFELDQWKGWVENAKRASQDEKVDGFPKAYSQRYTAVMAEWKSWGKGAKQWTKDKRLNNDRNMYVSNPENGILRRPSVNGDEKAIYVAFDKHGEVIAFLDPQGIPWSYDKDIHELMKDDSHEFYSKTKAPVAKSNKRHISERDLLRKNSTLKPDWCGSDHYGNWHAVGQTKDPILETSDSRDITATERQLLLQFLKYTGGPMTRVLDFWFGVWEPQLRQRYRDIYAKSPEFARLPPVNEDHPETYCLRVSVCNRPTDEHRDQKDIKRGLTGLVHLGDFKGAAMCINQLGIALDGYGDGAALLFRGTELKHYISEWSGNYRYAFDHTTHQSVENAIKEHENTGRWGPKKGPTAPEGPKESKGGKKTKKPDDKNDGKPDGGDGSGKPPGKTRKRSRDNDDDEEPSGEPVSKKRATTLAMKGERQIRATKQKSSQVKEQESAIHQREKGVYKLRQGKKGKGRE